MFRIKSIKQRQCILALSELMLYAIVEDFNSWHQSIFSSRTSVGGNEQEKANALTIYFQFLLKNLKYYLQLPIDLNYCAYQLAYHIISYLFSYKASKYWSSKDSRSTSTSSTPGYITLSKCLVGDDKLKLSRSSESSIAEFFFWDFPNVFVHTID